MYVVVYVVACKGCVLFPHANADDMMMMKANKDANIVRRWAQPQFNIRNPTTAQLARDLRNAACYWRAALAWGSDRRAGLHDAYTCDNGQELRVYVCECV